MGGASKMATPGELVRTVATVLGIPEATVVQHDRNLASGGLRTKGGRGRSAARVTSEDAANLLIAICGAPISGASVKETLATCNRFGPLRAYGYGTKLGNFSRLKSQLPTLGKLAPGHSFREAISALIDSLAAGEFEYEGRPTGSISVSFDGPTPSGIISVEKRRSTHLFYRESQFLSPSRSDLTQDRSFSIKTLAEIARVIGRRDAPPDEKKIAIEATILEQPLAGRGRSAD
jgi:hypothetical protein